MTDRVKGLVITLEKDVRIDDMQKVMDAIRCFRGVLEVSPLISEPNDYVVERRISQGLRDKLYTLMAEL